MYESPHFFINGEAVRPKGLAECEVINPATEDVLGTCPLAGEEEVAAALASAQRGLAAWRNVSAWQRAGILRKVGSLLRERAQKIARFTTLEVGKTLTESAGEISVAADTLEWCADEARRIYDYSLPGRSTTSRFEVCHEPVGVVLALSPWNGPISLGTRKLAMALAAGCSVILRPAEEAPACVSQLVKCFHDAGVPPGVINLLFGTPEAVVTPLMVAHAVRMVSFTGSPRIGQVLVRQSADTLKRLMLELGGHAPVIIMGDADISKVAIAAADRKTRNAGQVCTSPSRFFVHRSVADEFLEKFSAKMNSIKVGDGTNTDNQMGPLTTRLQRDRTERLVEDAREKGATITTGGARPKHLNRGYFYQPTVLTNVPDNARIVSEEPFCPVASVVPIADADEALMRANAIEPALAAYVFTTSGKQADHILRNIHAGVTSLNNFVVASSELPFGGIKSGGYGREGGIEGVKAYLSTKSKHMTEA